MSLMKSKQVPPPTLEAVLDDTRVVCADYLPVALEAQVESMRKLYEIDPSKAIQEVKRLQGNKRAAEGMARKRRQDKERERLQQTVETAKAVVLVEQENDLKRKEQYKALLSHGYSTDQIVTRDSDQDLAVIFNDAYEQIRRGQVDFDITDLGHWQIEFCEVRAKYEFLRKQRRSGFVPEKQLLSPAWLQMAGQLADFRLAAIEKFLTDSGIANLWRPEEHTGDCYGQPRIWQSWKFVPVHSPAVAEESPRAPMTIPLEQALPKSPEPVDISVTQIELDGKTIAIPNWPSSRL